MLDYGKKIGSNAGEIVPNACPYCIGSCKGTCEGDCDGTCVGDCSKTCKGSSRPK